MTGTVRVCNMPDRYSKYVVARSVGGKLWFWGSWEDSKKANSVADEIGNAIVVEFDV